jgi:hypothetical protein
MLLPIVRCLIIVVDVLMGTGNYRKGVSIHMTVHMYPVGRLTFVGRLALHAYTVQHRHYIMQVLCFLSISHFQQ